MAKDLQGWSHQQVYDKIVQNVTKLQILQQQNLEDPRYYPSLELWLLPEKLDEVTVFQLNDLLYQVAAGCFDFVYDNSTGEYTDIDQNALEELKKVLGFLCGDLAKHQYFQQYGLDGDHCLSIDQLSVSQSGEMQIIEPPSGTGYVLVEEMQG